MPDDLRHQRRNLLMKRDIWGKKGTNGIVPAIVLITPRYANNVGMVVRLAAAYGIKQVWFTGTDVEIDVKGGGRLPREERMKGYRDVDIINYDYPFDRFKAGTPVVGVEVMPGAELLPNFEHPSLGDAVYVFGPENGSIDAATRRHCHRFVVIPTKHCLNLATAVSTVLYDRLVKREDAGAEEFITPGEAEQRGQFIDADSGLGWQDAQDDVTHSPTGTVRAGRS